VRAIHGTLRLACGADIYSSREAENEMVEVGARDRDRAGVHRSLIVATARVHDLTLVTGDTIIIQSNAVKVLEA
jgi:predicted nucleic acid-binding protein